MQYTDQVYKEYEPFIDVEARKRSKLGVDYDDLIQEARMQILLSLAGNFPIVELDIINAMRRYIKNQRAQKTTYYLIKEA